MKIILLPFFIFVVTSMTGCFTASPDDSKIPQSRPASWEYSLPGGFDRGGFNR
jgi:hypothetical protein